MYAIDQHFILVLDDWHLVDHVREITELIADVLLRCLNCHLILTSRIYPSLPDIMLLAARRQMSGLDEEHLRFTAPEIAAVLGAEYATAVPLAEAQALADQSNGWITGVLLAYQVTGSAASSPGAPTGTPRQIYRFLAEQVFERQEPAIREFLLQSALLEELSAERCDAIFERSDSGLLLQTLLRLHLFITEIEPGVLRYHPLFREFLLDHYRIENPQSYHQTAMHVAAAYMAHGQISLAFDTYMAIGDVTAACDVVAVGGQQLHSSGRLETLERWFGVLALDDLSAPLLCLKVGCSEIGDKRMKRWYWLSWLRPGCDRTRRTQSDCCRRICAHRWAVRGCYSYHGRGAGKDVLYSSASNSVARPCALQPSAR